MTAPDLTTEIIGYRQWYVTPDLELRAAHKAKHLWTPGDNRAVCHKDVDYSALLMGHTAPRAEACKAVPGADCACGLYALHSPSDFWYGEPNPAKTSALPSAMWYEAPPIDPLVSGVIVAWGSVEVHWLGFRAEFARVVALAMPERRRDAAVVKAVAAEFGVACVPVNDLPKIAAEFGVVVPKELRPAKRDEKLHELDAYKRATQQTQRILDEHKALMKKYEAITRPSSSSWGSPNAQYSNPQYSNRRRWWHLGS